MRVTTRHVRPATRLPKDVLAVVLCEDDVDDRVGIAGFAAFAVSTTTGFPGFRCHRFDARSGHPIEAVAERLAGLADGRHVVLGQAAVHGDFWDWDEMLRIGSGFVSFVRPFTPLSPRDMTLLTLTPPLLARIPEPLQMTVTTVGCSEGGIALARAKMLWLGLVAARLRGRAREALFAAYQAWQACDRARSIGHDGGQGHSAR